jgi:hypothetical protein
LSGKWFNIELYLGITFKDGVKRGKKDMKRFAIIVTAIALLFCTCFTEAFAAASDSGTSAQKKVMFYLKPDISVELNGVRQV